MDPPPAVNPSSSAETKPSNEPLVETVGEPSTVAKMKSPMGPPPAKIPEPSVPNTLETQNNTHEQSQSNLNPTQVAEPVKESAENSINEPTQRDKPQKSFEVPYTIPPWSCRPRHHFSLEVLKDGLIIDQFDVYDKGAYMFGRVDLCDFVLEHPTISRFHAVLQFKGNGEAYLYDLGSTHGTFINKNRVSKNVYVELHVGDVIRFGQSSRLYILQGPSELMQPETDLKSISKGKMLQEMRDREASLLRAKREASLADGISWGMGEDAIEEDEDDVDEVTWQTYKGQLTEKQEKTREKVIKRTEKIAHMKKEIDAIRAKDIAQGGLTQGQQTQIARNEQRISQIMEELENLEETLNESIRESLGARSGKASGSRNKGATEDEDVLSDDDEFYDRTRKKTSIQKAGENQSIETADTLLDKKDDILKEIGEKRELLLKEQTKMPSITEGRTEAGDVLDAYMSGLSSKLVLDAITRLEKELSSLESELGRTLYLLKIADPTGEASKKRDSKLQVAKANQSENATSTIPKQPKNGYQLVKPASNPTQIQKTTEADVKPAVDPTQTKTTTETDVESAKPVTDEKESQKTTMYTVPKPQWLGAVHGMETKEVKPEAPLNMNDSDQFVDYNDRKKILGESKSGIENAAPGLIIRKRREADKDENVNEQLTSSSSSTGSMVEDAVALLLKHKRGYYASDDGVQESEDPLDGNQSGKDRKKQKNVLGPERPSFLNHGVDYESWVPPEGQSGDGRTSLNDRYGY